MKTRAESLLEALKQIDDTSKTVNFMDVDKFDRQTTNLILSHIAMNLAVIADKLTEGDNECQK